MTPEFSILLFADGRFRKADDKLTRILKWRLEDLFGLPFTTLVPPEAHDLVAGLFQEGIELDGVTFPQVPLRFKPGGYIKFDMKASKAGSDLILEFFKPGSLVVAEPVEVADTETFFKFVEQMISGDTEGDMGLTMVKVDGLADPDIAEDAKAKLRQSVEAALSKQATGGKIGALDDSSYGFLVDDSYDEDALEKELETVAKGLGIPHEKMGLKAQKLTIDDRNIDPETLKTALNHARGVFIGDISSGDDFGSLSEVISGIEHHRNLIRTAIELQKFRASPRYVRDGRDQNVSICALMEGKVNIDGYLRPPDDLIVLRDHKDLALLHDLAQIRELMRLRRFQEEYEKRKRQYFDLSVATLADPAFSAGLESILTEHNESADVLGFRIVYLPTARRGGAAWENLSSLVKKGHRVWIDRFADIVTDKDKLAIMKGGIVEISASFLDRIAGHPDGRAMVTRLIGIWEGKGVNVIYANLRTYEQKVIAQELGVGLALEDPDTLAV